jgi:GNAT superfamily N-acetyltransferase
MGTTNERLELTGTKIPTIDWFAGSREALAELFALADDSPAAVRGYRLAVQEDHQGAGIGRMLMQRAAAACREEQRTRLLVATAAADTRVLRFYQLLGFRMLRVERDVFTAEAGYPPVDVDGIPLRDRVWLSLDL